VQNFRRYYLHFAAAYGTFWLAMILIALVTRSHINAGEFGFYIVPIICLIYATVAVKPQPKTPQQPQDLDKKIAELEAKINQIKFQQSVMQNNQNPQHPA
jgi:TolA-binding protein